MSGQFPETEQTSYSVLSLNRDYLSLIQDRGQTGVFLNSAPDITELEVVVLSRVVVVDSIVVDSFVVVTVVVPTDVFM